MLDLQELNLAGGVVKYAAGEAGKAAANRFLKGRLMELDQLPGLPEGEVMPMSELQNLGVAGAVGRNVVLPAAKGAAGAAINKWRGRLDL